MTLSSQRYALIPVCLIWLGVIAAAVAAGWFRSLALENIWPLAAVASAPAFLGLLLTPVIHREWAQILVILGWLALAVVAVLAVSFVPMAILFMCAPAAAALFEREKVVEAMVLAAILAAVLFYAGQQGVIPESLTNDVSKDWGQQMGIFATLAFLVTSLMTTAHSRGRVVDTAQETAIRHAQESRDADLDIFPGSFFMLNAKNQIQAVNQNARKNFDLSDTKGSTFVSMLGLDDAVSKSINDLIDRARKVSDERSGNFLIRSKPDEVDYLQFTVHPLENGTVGLAIHKLNDSYQEITRLQRENENTRKNSDEKSLFFAGVSHELRTPLNAIIGFSDMMRSRLFGPLPSKYAEYADMIHESGQHMLDLIGDVLDLSKVEAGKYELKYDTFQAEDIIRSSLKMVRPAADAAEIIMQANLLTEDDIIIQADRRAVRQILLNLLSNAIKFSPKGGTVITKAEQIGPNLRLSVMDQGQGMDADMIEKIGQPYLQTADDNMAQLRGTGLGLSLVKSLTELHGGTIHIESQLGKGTSVHVDLPLENVMA